MRMTLAALMLSASPAMAFDTAGDCTNTEAAMTVLASLHEEAVIWGGVDKAGAVVSLHMSAGGSWSIVMSGDGQSCLITFGTDAQIAGE